MTHEECDEGNTNDGDACVVEEEWRRRRGGGSAGGGGGGAGGGAEESESLRVESRRVGE